MTRRRTFSSGRELAAAKAQGKQTAIQRYLQSFSTFCDELNQPNPEQDKQVRYLLRKIGGDIRYSLNFGVGGRCHLLLYVPGCYRREARERLNRLQAYKSYNIRVDIAVKRNGH